MKKNYFSFLAIFFFFTAQAQFVGFEDMTFKDRLVWADVNNYTATDANDHPMKIDANDNGQIEFSEAENVYGLNVRTDMAFPFPLYIYSLVGIEAFINLRSLNCSLNGITSLDVTALQNLKNLDCSENPISFVNATGVALEALHAQDANITSLSQFGLQGSGLIWMELDRNNLGFIDVSNFPDLEVLSLTSCQLTGIALANLPSLEWLYLYQNQLTAVNLSGLPNLKWLYCYNNSLTSIDVSQNLLLNSLSVRYNELTDLDVSHNHSLYILDATNNHLNSINMKNGINEEVYLQSNPDLAYICADEGQVNDPDLMVNPITQVNSYCSFIPGGMYHVVTGISLFDNDSNGCDAQDVPIPNVRFLVSEGSIPRTIICNDSGSYSVSLPDGDYTMTPTIENAGYFNFSPAVASFSFPEVASPFAQNFCITANGVHPDLEIIVTPLNVSRPGFDSYFRITYKNKGNQTQSGIINFTFDDAVFDLVASNPSVVSQSLNQLMWNFDNLAPFEVRQIDVTLHLNSPTDTPPVNGGHMLNLASQILTDATDETPSDNSFSLTQTVVNSFDPNDKTCLEGDTVTPEMVGTYVHYLIRFENLGTASAENVVVVDVIDNDKFEIGSLVPLDGSHDYVTRINGNKVEFIFEGINLPFDDANSDGYVLFKIKTKPTLVLDDTFSNTASIYFDYNHPIVTNTATTTVGLLQTADFAFSEHFALYPNPAADRLYIQSNDKVDIQSVSIYNVLGQLVMTVVNPQPMKAIDVSILRAGNYFIQIQSIKGISNAQFLKK